jgi:hypothetical protein
MIEETESTKFQLFFFVYNCASVGIFEFKMVVRHIFNNNCTEADFIFLWMPNEYIRFYIIKDYTLCF